MSPPPVSHRFLRYRILSDATHRPRIGLVDTAETTVTEVLGYLDLFRLIEAHPHLAADHKFETGDTTQMEDLEVLAPLPGRDVLCVCLRCFLLSHDSNAECREGVSARTVRRPQKRHHARLKTDADKAHAAEFHLSGFDSSDKNEQPDFPVFFTKRATSIIACGQPIYTHPEVTSSPDYEGELGIIIGKAGLGVTKEDAWHHVWGAVIINDVTARERQRDHKQFYIGKSLDTFCPMGPYVVPASSLSFPELHLTTRVNNEVRQSQNTSELIFDVPTLIATGSMGISIQPGDVIATGTPVGVGMGMDPKVWLKDGDVVEVEIPPLGRLWNPVTSQKPAVRSLRDEIN
ncbi:unnamed protein product [Mycena citricolor]|uniref:Fumarylacetoacetase-like C-terminal domain-containing protein n=1 Tax=Mycena citricolor TaxID=2018698 RepID=A0AAD2GTN2_9AGAR|nr:unnamed protein product [Mycena citricolor]